MMPIIEPQVSLEGETSLEAITAMAKRVGFSAIAISGKKFTKEFRKQLEKTPITVYTRTNLIEDNLNKVKRHLAKNRTTVDLVAVQTRNAKVAQWVVKDNRVDILSIPLSSSREIITQPLANVASQVPIFFELNLEPFLQETLKQNHSRYLRQLSRVINVLLRERAPFIFTLAVKEPLAFRDARNLIAFGTVLGVPYPHMKGNYTSFRQRLQRNRRRLEGGFIAPGIWRAAEAGTHTRQPTSPSSPRKDDHDDSLIFIPQSLKEKRLERQRYLLFEIISEKEEAAISERAFMDTFWSTFSRLFGEINSSRAGVYLSYFSSEEKIGILRTSHRMVAAVRTAFLVMNNLCNEKVIIHVKRTSGTIAKLRKARRK